MIGAYLRRDVLVAGQRQRWYLIPVEGSIDPTLTLGWLAIRCARLPDRVEPLTLAIPDHALLQFTADA